MEKRASRRRVVIFTGALFLCEPRDAPPPPRGGGFDFSRGIERKRRESLLGVSQLFDFFFFLFVIERKRNYFGINFDSRYYLIYYIGLN